MTAEGDEGKGRVRRESRKRTRHTDRGWPVNSGAEEKTIVLFFSPLTGALCDLGKELKTSGLFFSITLSNLFVYYSAS